MRTRRSHSDFPSGPNRREFLKTSLLGLSAVIGSVASAKPSLPSTNNESKKPDLCFFSKPLEKLDYSQLTNFCAELGVPGIDLTVRSPGHVSPVRVEQDLVAAVQAIKAAGLKVPMITTAIVDPQDATTEAIIQTAGGLGIPYLKLGYFHYKQFDDIPQQLAQVREKVQAICQLCQKYKVQAGFHNHSGAYVGAAMWDVWNIIKDLPEDWIGSYFDPAHATVEGGGAAWKIGLNLLSSRLKMVAIKDFRWERAGTNAKSKAVFGPLGNGEVNWKEVFALLKSSGFGGSISLHVEYTALTDHSKPERERMMKLAKQDLGFLRNSLQQAGVI